MKRDKDDINKLTDGIIGWFIREGRPGKITLDSVSVSDSLLTAPEHEEKEGKTRWEKVKNFFMLASYKHLKLIFSVLSVALLVGAVLYYTSKFFTDVVFHENKFYANEQGTFICKKSLDREFAFFVFNTSDVWANPGIQINEDDDLRINISGGFNSSIMYMLDAAKANQKPKYLWVTNGFNKKWNYLNWALEYCISRGSGSENNKFDFGTVMYTIQPESSDISNHPYRVPPGDILAWSPGDRRRWFSGSRAFNKLNETGYLYFTVNDLAFDEIHNGQDVVPLKEVINSYYDKYSLNLIVSIKIKELLIKTKEIIIKDSLSLKNYIDNVNEEFRRLKKEQGYVQKDPFALYKDNLGQLMVSVEIQHNSPRWFFKPMMAYRCFENNLTELWDDSDMAWVFKLFVTLFYIVLLTFHVAFTFVVKVLQIFIAVYLVLLVLSLFYRLFRLCRPILSTSA